MPRFPTSFWYRYLLRDYESWAHKAGHVIWLAGTVSMLPGTTVRYGANGGVTPDVTFDPNSHALYVR